jgi:hypothetical protein
VVLAVDGIVFQHDPTDHVAQLVIGSVEAPEPAPARRRGRPWPQAAANHVGLRVRVATAGGRGADLRGGAVREEPVAHVGHRAALDALAGVRAAELGWLGGDCAGHGVGVGEEDLAGAMARLNESAGRRYLIEVCTQFVERIFGGRRPHSCGRTPV